jgi:hypothetical protein
MKKKAVLIFVVLFVIASVAAVIAIEKNSKTPMERFLETSQTTKQPDNYIPAKIIDYDGGLQYEFLSYELIDDKDIEKQKKYKAEYFIDGKVPPSDYVVKKVDHAAMRRDFPKYDEYVSSNCTKGMTYEEYEEFMREHEDEYSSEVHVRTKYFFIRCRITYVGGDVNDTNRKCLNFDFLIMNGDKRVGDSHNPNCYFDLSQNTEGKEQKTDSVYYTFGKLGDSIECVLGGRLIDENDCFSKATGYYVGFLPWSYEEAEKCNPAIDSKFVALKDMPKEPEPA